MDMDSILKRAQEFQHLMSRKQEELAGRTVTSTVGGGMVTVIVNGKFEIVSLQIDKVAINPAEAEMLQDLVVAAVNDAMRKAKEMTQSELAKLTGGLGLNLPGMFGG
ncbi:MAG: YbaB/EbfC family nucleoid-associated protein [Desulfurivibrio sp.]|jgi:DNA-binding YbaB/EbfC family protein|nr:MAG: YbaB/EbfC family nucleoid-associated protein [Desulfurivibrio sp.]